MASKKQGRLHNGASAKVLNMRAIWLGVLNASLPGLGYVFISGRRLFGWLLFFGTLCALLSRHYGFLALNTHTFNAPAVFLQLCSVTLASLAFGYDAFRQAQASSK